ncbi:MAG: F0F1 ATP synthase subunit A [Bacteroidetes bacterium]|nr:F0F1 ATP synthase subunit A [Bacteroidota bacterium]
MLCLFLSISYISLQAEVQDDHQGDQTEHTAQETHEDAGHDTDAHAEDAHGTHEAQGDHHEDHGHGLDCHVAEFNAGDVAKHHVADANVFSIGPWSIPLPCIVYVKGEGFNFFSSGKLEPGHHGNGHKAYDRFVLYHHALNRVDDASFPIGEVEVECFGHETLMVDGTEKEVTYVMFHGERYDLDAKSTIDGGLFGGGITSFYDFSLTKNVVTMIVVFALLSWMFVVIAKGYVTREGNAPKGIQSFMEPIFMFIQDEVAKPILGHSWQKYQPFLMALFFFILGLNLFGQIPFFGNANVTGNISVTIALALFTLLVVNISGNSNYWQHVFWMPGVPAFVKIILTPVEILGVFLKPMTLFIRLFGNISAGHMVIVIFVSLIFIFGNAGQNIAGGVTGAALAIPLTIFMMALELLVAFLQAFVFTILTAVYIGAAIEDHH